MPEAAVGLGSRFAPGNGCGGGGCGGAVAPVRGAAQAQVGGDRPCGRLSWLGLGGAQIGSRASTSTLRPEGGDWKVSFRGGALNRRSLGGAVAQARGDRICGRPSRLRLGGTLSSSRAGASSLHHDGGDWKRSPSGEALNRRCLAGTVAQARGDRRGGRLGRPSVGGGRIGGRACLRVASLRVPPNDIRRRFSLRQGRGASRAGRVLGCGGGRLGRNGDADIRVHGNGGEGRACSSGLRA